MTIEADPGRGVLTVAIGTILTAVSTGQIDKVLLNLLMTGDADRCVRLIVLQIHQQRLMWRMAGLAFTDRIMRVVVRRVTHEAGIGDSLPFLRVLAVTA